MERKKRVWITKTGSDFLECVHLDYKDGRIHCQDTALTLTRPWIVDDLKNRLRIYESRPPTTEHQKVRNGGKVLSSKEIIAFEDFLKMSPYRTREGAQKLLEQYSTF